MIILFFEDAPECSITRTEKDGSPALLCTVQANPQDVGFYWKAKEGNETYSIVEGSNIIKEGLKSFLILDSTVDTKRTYQCFANNSVGFSDKQPCEMEVAGNFLFIFDVFFKALALAKSIKYLKSH